MLHLKRKKVSNMAKTSNRTDTPKIKKQTPLKGAAGKAAKFSNDWLMPQNASDVAMLLFPYGKVAKGVGRAVKKVIKPASKTKKVTKLAEPKSAVRVKPARTASGPGLETRGAKLTKSQRSERAAELSFKKLEGRWEGEYLTRMTGLKGPKGVTSQTTRGQGNRSLRKDAAIDKEAKPVIKINSAKPTRPRPAKKSAAQLRPKKK